VDTRASRRQKTGLLARASIASQSVDMAAAMDKEFDSGIHEVPSRTVRKGEDVMGRQTELESGQHGSELASIERVERVYRYVICHQPLSGQDERSINKHS
jgi:hypothetical protein